MQSFRFITVLMNLLILLSSEKRSAEGSTNVTSSDTNIEDLNNSFICSLPSVVPAVPKDGCGNNLEGPPLVVNLRICRDGLYSIPIGSASQSTNNRSCQTRKLALNDRMLSITTIESIEEINRLVVLNLALQKQMFSLNEDFICMTVVKRSIDAENEDITEEDTCWDTCIRSGGARSQSVDFFTHEYKDTVTNPSAYFKTWHEVTFTVEDAALTIEGLDDAPCQDTSSSRDPSTSGGNTTAITVGSVAAISLILAFLFYRYRRPSSSDTSQIPSKPENEVVNDHESVFRYDAFFTHNWGEDENGRDNHARVAKINNEFKKLIGSTWFDEERMRGNIIDQMSRGIDESMVVVVFLTQKYIAKVAGKGPNGNDDNCKFEFEYAMRRKGVENLIVVVMEDACSDTKSWIGSVGIALGSHLHYSFKKDEELDQCVIQLAQNIAIRKARFLENQFDC